jgi:hypothetical protein
MKREGASSRDIRPRTRFTLLDEYEPAWQKAARSQAQPSEVALLGDAWSEEETVCPR